MLNAAANRLGARTAAATELRRRAYARHRFDFDAFDIDVLVLDLAAWRIAAVLPTYIPYLEEFGLTLRELLHLAVGPDRAVVPQRWYAVPGRSVIANPALALLGRPDQTLVGGRCRRAAAVVGSVRPAAGRAGTSRAAWVADRADTVSRWTDCATWPWCWPVAPAPGSG